MSDATEGTRKRGGPRPPRCNKEVAAKRVARAYQLDLQGKSMREIAAELGVSERQSQSYLKTAHDEARQMLADLHGQKGIARQFSVLVYVQSEAINAWERSKLAKVTTTRGVKDELSPLRKKGSEDEDEGGNPIAQQRTVNRREEAVVGSQGYLSLILSASTEIRELLGLDAAKVKLLLHEATQTDSKGLTIEELRSGSHSNAELVRKLTETLGAPVTTPG